MDISRLEGKVISYKSLVIVVSKEKKTFHYIFLKIMLSMANVFFGVKLSIDGKVIAKALSATSKKKAEESIPTCLFAFQEKWIKNNAKLLKTTTFSL
jgi:ribonuclease-3